MTNQKGRPPSTKPKAAALQIRLTADQREYLEAEKERLGFANLADLARSKLLPKRLR